MTPVNNEKQVRFDLKVSNTGGAPRAQASLYPDSLPRHAPQEDTGDERVYEEHYIHVYPQPPPQPPLSASPSCSLDLSVYDEPGFSRSIERTSISSPKINSLKALQEEVLRLANRVQNASNSVRLSGNFFISTIKLHCLLCYYRRQAQRWSDKLYKNLPTNLVCYPRSPPCINVPPRQPLNLSSWLLEISLSV